MCHGKRVDSGIQAEYSFNWIPGSSQRQHLNDPAPYAKSTASADVRLIPNPFQIIFPEKSSTVASRFPVRAPMRKPVRETREPFGKTTQHNASYVE